MPDPIDAPLFHSAREIWQAGVERVQGASVIQNEVSVDSGYLRVRDSKINLAEIEKVFVFGAGKAGASMAAGLAQVVEASNPSNSEWTGQIHVIDGPGFELNETIAEPWSYLKVRDPSDNFPTPRAVAATMQLVERLKMLGPNDLSIGLISGGASAMVALPVPGVTLSEKRNLIETLSANGANIHELNLVRKHVSAVKGGKLMCRGRAGKKLNLFISDVIGDSLETIGSGLTVALNPNFELALETLKRLDPQGRVASSIYQYLESGPDQSAEPHQFIGVKNLILANNRTAIDASVRRAKELGFDVVNSSGIPTEGDANEIGVVIANHLERSIDLAANSGNKTCLIFGGETTVRLCPNPGLGGRNQQLTLAALEHCLDENKHKNQKMSFCVLSAGTDGEDGPTDAAGAWFDDQMLNEEIQRDEISHCLGRNDALNFFESKGRSFKTGPTGTNVCDLQILLVDPNAKQ